MHLIPVPDMTYNVFGGTLSLTQSINLTPNPNTNTNPNSRYTGTLTFFKNAGYETPGYEKVAVRNVWHLTAVFRRILTSTYYTSSVRALLE